MKSKEDVSVGVVKYHVTFVKHITFNTQFFKDKLNFLLTNLTSLTPLQQVKPGVSNKIL